MPGYLWTWVDNLKLYYKGNDKQICGPRSPWLVITDHPLDPLTSGIAFRTWIGYRKCPKTRRLLWMDRWKEKLLQGTKFTAGHKESPTLEISDSNHFEDPDLIWTGYIWCKSSVCACMGKPYDEIIWMLKEPQFREWRKSLRKGAVVLSDVFFFSIRVFHKVIAGSLGLSHNFRWIPKPFQQCVTPTFHVWFFCPWIIKLDSWRPICRMQFV